jgi:3-oxoacyl-[acyl-carrier-protein] synthase II
MSRRRVFISGIGAVTPYGLGAATLRSSLFSGRSAIGPIRGFDASRFPTRFGGEIPPVPLAEHFDERELTWLSTLAAHSVVAARLAFEDAGLSGVELAETAGVAFGTGFGSLAESGPHFLRWTEIGDAAARPTTIPVLMLNAPAAQIARSLSLSGPALTIATACSSGSNAIGHALREIRDGRQEVMLAGGGEHALTELMLLSWTRLRVLSRRNGDPARASRPFDADRDGLVLADAVVLCVLESEEHLARRGKTPLAEIAGFGSNCGADHLTAPDEASEVAAMRAALDDAAVDTDELDLVLAHGTATRRNDLAEGRALRALLGAGAGPAVAAVKSMIGHSMGASGPIGVAAAAYALSAGTVPPTINLDALDPHCEVSGFVPEATSRPLAHAMVNAFAFGGHNAVIVLRRASEVVP